MNKPCKYNLYSRLNSDAKKALANNSVKYSDSTKAIILKLENTVFYSDLTIQEVNSTCTFSDVQSYQWSANDWRFGEKLFSELILVDGKW
tara:strand:+ start:102 stop:371 length:270 start_codon:yes stop_codon:yes gene_type:complete